jgi:hypothetical protein
VVSLKENIDRLRKIIVRSYVPWIFVYGTILCILESGQPKAAMVKELYRQAGGRRPKHGEPLICGAFRTTAKAIQNDREIFLL